jgi:hypothetical protein
VKKHAGERRRQTQDDDVMGVVLCGGGRGRLEDSRQVQSSKCLIRNQRGAISDLSCCWLLRCCTSRATH